MITNHDRAEFERDWQRTGRMIHAVWAVAIVVSLAFLGLIAWAVIELVQWLTTK